MVNLKPSREKVMPYVFDAIFKDSVISDIVWMDTSGKGIRNKMAAMHGFVELFEDAFKVVVPKADTLDRAELKKVPWWT